MDQEHAAALRFNTSPYKFEVQLCSYCRVLEVISANYAAVILSISQ